MTSKSYGYYFHGQNIARALNDVLKHETLESYDWILRVDCDVILPPDFLERNSKLNVDLIGKGGSCMMIRPRAFRRWSELPPEDALMMYSVMMRGFRIGDFIVKPIEKRGAGNQYSARYCFHSGKELRKLGYFLPFMFMQALKHAADWNPLKALAWFAGYLTEHREKYETWNFVRALQIDALRKHS